jgi:hypothetical protein
MEKLYELNIIITKIILITINSLFLELSKKLNGNNFAFEKIFSKSFWKNE